jgi:hypothetical protein
MPIRTKACLAKRDCECRHCGGQILLGYKVHYAEGGGFLHLGCVQKFRRRENARAARLTQGEPNELV